MRQNTTRGTIGGNISGARGMDWIQDAIKWLGDESHNRAAETILAVIIAIIGGSGWLFINGLKKTKEKKSEPQKQEINSSEASSSPSVIGEGATINYNQSDPKIAAEMARLNDKIDELKSELKETADPARTDVLLKLITESHEKQNNIEEELEKYEEALKEASDKLDSYRDEFGEARIAEAQKALDDGYTTKALSLFAEIEKTSDERSADAASGQGQLLLADLDYFGAYEKFKKAAGLRPDNHKYQNMAGELATKLAYYDEAEKYCVLAIEEAKKTLSPTDPFIAECLDNLGEVLFYRRDLKAAKEKFMQALAIAEKDQEQGALIAKELNNLGGVLYSEGNLAGAREKFQRALDMDLKFHGHEHTKVATRLNNLGMVLHDEGNLAGAKEKYQMALDIDIKFHGHEHTKVANRLNNLGTVLMEEGNLAGAKEKLQQALDIDRNAYGDNHPKTKKTKNNFDIVIKSMEEKPE